MKKLNEQEMLHRMAAYCSSAERCEQDVRQKLVKAELEPEAVSRIINRLRQEKFIDEARFARAFVSDKFRFNHWGKYKIRCELLRKEISEEEIELALSSLEMEEYDQVLMDLLKTKMKSVKAKDERERYYKLLRFAVGRGFQPAEAGACLKRLLNGGDHEEFDMD